MSSSSAFKRRAGSKAGAVAFGALESRFRAKSAESAERAGARLGRLFYRLSKKHRNRALGNLRLAMPELGEAEREKIALGVFEHFGRIAGDFLRSMERSEKEVLASIEVEERGARLEDLKDPRGVIAMTAHFGNWERLAHWYSLTVREITVVARDANDAAMNDQVLRIRQHSGVNVVSRGTSTRSLVRLLRGGGSIGILPDQNSEEAYLPFFGKPCGTVLGPAKLCRMTGAPIVTLYCARIGPAKYKLILGEKIVAEEGLDDQAIMTLANASLEKIIREFPEQWLWIHDRWKSARYKGLL